jgi:hypothetical protein
MTRNHPSHCMAWGAVRRVVALVGALMVSLGTVTSGFAAGGTNPTWVVQSTPNPSAVHTSVLYGVSCPSSSACSAVGGYFNGAVESTLAERWSGTGWAAQATPNPSGAQDSGLVGVSCASTSVCTAVGSYTNGSGTPLTLAEHWNGAGWAIQSTPNPSGAKSSVLSAVSCSSASACTAVGNYTNSSGTYLTLAEHWNGATWAVQATPNPTGARYSVLSGVSCPSSTACIAVGQYLNSASVMVTLAERWNGTIWAVQATPNPTGATSSDLSGVSCWAVTACVAVGDSYKSPTQATLAERWNGTSWVIQSSPNPTGAELSVLSDVSCFSATACAAAGYYYGASTVDLTLAERWNGTSWAVQVTPNPTGAQSSILSGVSCSSSSACTTVGNEVNSSAMTLTLAERWNGTTWAIQSTPQLLYSNVLEGVSCPSSTACTAVGQYQNSSGTYLTLAERWNGTSWTVQATPNPAGALFSALYEVSCPSTTACTAVGVYVNTSGVDVTLAERWNGTSWTVQATPVPAGAPFSELYDVSCSAAAACTAVGEYKNSSGVILALAERWNGTSWVVQTTPSPASAQFTTMLGVSCASSTACTGVGEYGNGVMGLTLAERWNGTTWAVEASPNPTGARLSSLFGVSCLATGACTSVGEYENSAGVFVTLAERWNGTTWAVEASPNPIGAKSSVLFGVSCLATGVCTAVGEYENSAAVIETLAEGWNGTSWVVQPTPVPAGAQDSRLFGVACSAASECTAVGRIGYAFGTADIGTLAERYS